MPDDPKIDDLDILNLGEPEEVVQIPERKDLPIEPSSHVSHCKTPEHPKEITWVCQEVLGTEVIKLPNDLQTSTSTPEDLAALTKEYHKHRLTSFHDLKVGDLILARGFSGWNVVKIDELRPERKNGSALNPNGKTLYMLQFDNDDRHCWVCIGSGTLIGLERLTLR